ncbi:MAG: hypothetical protein ACJAZS_000676 [Alteromonas naphthalenivorans]|jgi:hypothetical protein
MNFKIINLWALSLIVLTIHPTSSRDITIAIQNSYKGGVGTQKQLRTLCNKISLSPKLQSDTAVGSPVGTGFSQAYGTGRKTYTVYNACNSTAFAFFKKVEAAESAYNKPNKSKQKMASAQALRTAIKNYINAGGSPKVFASLLKQVEKAIRSASLKNPPSKAPELSTITEKLEPHILETIKEELEEEAEEETKEPGFSGSTMKQWRDRIRNYLKKAQNPHLTFNTVKNDLKHQLPALTSTQEQELRFFMMQIQIGIELKSKGKSILKPTTKPSVASSHDQAMKMETYKNRIETILKQNPQARFIDIISPAENDALTDHERNELEEYYINHQGQQASSSAAGSKPGPSAYESLYTPKKGLVPELKAQMQKALQYDPHARMSQIFSSDQRDMLTSEQLQELQAYLVKQKQQVGSSVAASTKQPSNSSMATLKNTIKTMFDGGFILPLSRIITKSQMSNLTPTGRAELQRYYNELKAAQPPAYQEPAQQPQDLLGDNLATQDPNPVMPHTPKQLSAKQLGQYEKLIRNALQQNPKPEFPDVLARLGKSQATLAPRDFESLLEYYSTQRVHLEMAEAESSTASSSASAPVSTPQAKPLTTAEMQTWKNRVATALEENPGIQMFQIFAPYGKSPFHFAPKDYQALNRWYGLIQSTVSTSSSASSSAENPDFVKPPSNNQDESLDFEGTGMHLNQRNLELLKTKERTEKAKPKRSWFQRLRGTDK